MDVVVGIEGGRNGFEEKMGVCGVCVGAAGTAPVSAFDGPWAEPSA